MCKGAGWQCLWVLGAGVPYTGRKKLPFGICKCCLQFITIILLFAVILTAIIVNHIKCKRIFSDALFQCIRKLNDIFRYLFSLNLAFLFCFSIVRHASTQHRMPAPSGMVSQHLRTFERCYLNLPNIDI